MGCRLWGRTELDTTEATQQQQQQVVISEEREEERGKEDSDIQTTMYKIKSYKNILYGTWNIVNYL